MTANETLIRGIARNDAHPALLVPATDDVVTYTQLADAVLRIAGQLAGTGVGPGDVVALSARNGPPFVLAFLGIIAAGAAAAPLNPAYTADELDFYLSDLQPSALILPPDITRMPFSTTPCDTVNNLPPLRTTVFCCASAVTDTRRRLRAMRIGATASGQRPTIECDD